MRSCSDSSGCTTLSTMGRLQFGRCFSSMRLTVHAHTALVINQRGLVGFGFSLVLVDWHDIFSEYLDTLRGCPVVGGTRWLVRYGSAFAKVSPRQRAEAESLCHRDAEAQSSLHRGVEARGSHCTCQGSSRPPRQGPVCEEAAGGACVARPVARTPPMARPGVRWRDCSSVDAASACASPCTSTRF